MSGQRFWQETTPLVLFAASEVFRTTFIIIGIQEISGTRQQVIASLYAENVTKRYMTTSLEN